MKKVIELHYDDGDCGAYEVDTLSSKEKEAVEKLWEGFITAHPRHKPSHIVIRLKGKNE